MTRRHRAFREPTLDSSKVNVRFSFQGPRQQACTCLLGVANHSRLVWPVNYFFESPGRFSSLPRFVLAPCGGTKRGAVPILREAADSKPSQRIFLVLEVSCLRRPSPSPPRRRQLVVGSEPSVKSSYLFFLTELNRLEVEAENPDHVDMELGRFTAPGWKQELGECCDHPTCYPHVDGRGRVFPFTP